MQGFNVAEAGHIVNVLSPQSISGGKTGQRFHVKNAAHVSIIVQIGAFGSSVPTAILVKVCQDVNGTNATAIPFRYYNSVSGGQSIDRTSPPAVATTSGITTFSKINNEFIVIEIDCQEILSTSDVSAGTDYPYIEWSVTDSGNATQMSAVAILSGNRYAGQGTSQPSITA